MSLAIQIANEPFSGFDRMLDKDPVQWSDAFGAWVVYGNAEASQVATDSKRFGAASAYKDSKGDAWKLIAGKPPERLASRDLRYLDGAPWYKFRKMHEASVPYKYSGAESRPKALRDQVQAIVTDHLVKSKGKANIEAMQEWCMPVSILANMGVLGVPAEDYSKMRDWTYDGMFIVYRFPSDCNFWSPEAADKANDAADSLIDYFGDLVAKRKAEPKGDFISRLIAYREQHDKSITDFEIVQVTVGHLMGGCHDSNAGLLAEGLYLLLSSGAYQDVVSDPSLIPGAVEEIIRFHPVVQYAPRVAMEDVVVGDKTIKKDQFCFLNLCAAQRDPRTYENAREFAIRREGASNGTLSFGAGEHSCTGPPLARMISNVFVESVTQTYPKLSLTQWPTNAYMSLRYQPRQDIVILESLPLTLG